MTLLPKVKLKTVVAFPATAIGRTGIDVAKQNGNFYIDLAFGDFAPPVPGIPDPDNQNVLLWNKLSGLYTLTPIAFLGGGGGTGGNPAEPIIITNPSAVIAGGVSAVAIRKTAPTTTALTLPSVFVQGGVPINIVDWSSSVTNHDITITPSGSETIMQVGTWQMFSSAASLGSIRLYPSTALNGWYIAP